MLTQAWKVLDERLRKVRAQEEGHIFTQVQKDSHGSLLLSPEVFQDIFMGDEWLTEMEMEIQPVKVEETDIDLIEPGPRAELFASGVSEEISGSFLERARRSSNHHRNTGSLGSL